MKNSRQLHRVLTTLVTSVLLVSCHGTAPDDGTGTSTSAALGDLPGDTAPGTGAASCSTPADLMTLDAAKITASFKETHCAKVRLCVKPEAWRDITPSTYIPGIDLVIVFDTTGSMTPYIQAMIRNMQQLITNLHGVTPSLRLGLVQYRDFADKGGSSGDLPFEPVIALTTDHQAVKDALGTLRARGGGDGPESLATALKAVADRWALPPYFNSYDVGFSADPTRVKVILGVTDAPNKTSPLPAGAPTLETAAQVLKNHGILFLGIGRKGTGYGSFDDLAYLANTTGAVVHAPGVDLDGDGLTTTSGEIATGDPAVLQMTASGGVLGAPVTGDPTRVLADAITAMVVRTRPLSFSLGIEANGRIYRPDSSNQLSVPKSSTDEVCFTDIEIDALNTHYMSCPSNVPFGIVTTEQTSATDIPTSALRVSWETSNCADAGPDTGTGTGTSSGTGTGTGSGTGTGTGSGTGTGTGLGGGIGV